MGPDSFWRLLFLSQAGNYPIRHTPGHFFALCFRNGINIKQIRVLLIMGESIELDEVILPEQIFQDPDQLGLNTRGLFTM